METESLKIGFKNISMLKLFYINAKLFVVRI